MGVQCCMTCAFCLKKLYKEKFTISILKDSKVEQLTEANSADALNGNFEFLTVDKNLYDDYKTEYDKRERVYLAEQERIIEDERKRHVTSAKELFLDTRKNDGDFPFWEEVHMPKPPFGPIEKVAICCAENCINEVPAEKVKGNTKLFNDNSCPFYFPIDERGEKLLDVCRQEREMKRSSNMNDITINNNNVNTNVQNNKIDIETICKESGLDEKTIKAIKDIISSQEPKESKTNKLNKILETAGAALPLLINLLVALGCFIG